MGSNLSVLEYHVDFVDEPVLLFNKGRSINPDDIDTLLPYSLDRVNRIQFEFFYIEGKEDISNKFLNSLMRKLRSWRIFVRILKNEGIKSLDELFKIFATNQPNERLVSILVIPQAIISDFGGVEKLKASGLSHNRRLHIIVLERLQKLYDGLQKYLNDKSRQNKKHLWAWNAYIRNNAVQIYAKSGGIPWRPEKPLATENSLILGISFRRINKNIYFSTVDVRDIHGYWLFFETIGPFQIDPVKGLYIPYDEMKTLIGSIIDRIKTIDKDSKSSSKQNELTLYIYKSSKFHSDELKALNEFNINYYGIHYAMHGFTRRGFIQQYGDIKTIKRGTVLLNPYTLKAILWASGDVSRTMTHKLGTPRPVEIQIYGNNISSNKQEKISMMKSICSQALTLTKLDWESTQWERREPVVIKYARRLAGIGIYLFGAPEIDKSTVSSMVNKLKIEDLM